MSMHLVPGATGACNGEGTADPAIASISAQPYQHCDLIIRDDGSTDATSARSRLMQPRIGKSRLVMLANPGANYQNGDYCHPQRTVAAYLRRPNTIRSRCKISQSGNRRRLDRFPTKGAEQLPIQIIALHAMKTSALIACNARSTRMVDTWS